MISTRVKVGIVGVVIVMAIGYASAVWTWHHQSAKTSAMVHQTDDGLAREIEQEIPLGSDRSVVLRFLRSHDIANGAYYKLGMGEGEPNGGASAVLDTVTQSMGSSVFHCRIHLTFRFDQSDKFLGFSHAPQCGAPF